MQPNKISIDKGYRPIFVGDAELQRPTAERMRAAMRRQFSRTVRSKPVFARLFLGSMLLSAFILGITFHMVWVHSVVLVGRSGEIVSSRYSQASLEKSTAPTPTSRKVSLISSAYTKGYPASRISELRHVILRNLQLSSLSQYQLLCENDVEFPTLLTNATSSLHLTTFSQPVGKAVTYRSLFEKANAQEAGSVAVIANADIYFDESLFCATLLDAKIAIALSRHPSPDCALASGHGDTGWEPLDFCAGYDPVKAASHDAFIVVTPLPESFLVALGDLQVNHFGAENVVVYLLKQAGYSVINPCANIHAFHQHCDARTRASTARHSAGSIAGMRKQFAGADKWGYQNVATWASPDFIDKTDGLDCLAYGLANRKSIP